MKSFYAIILSPKKITVPKCFLEEGSTKQSGEKAAQNVDEIDTMAKFVTLFLAF
jgi:hypothetical protein